MTDPLPDWMRQTPNLESLHNLPDIPWGGYRPRDIELPSLPDLALFVAKMLERFLKDVVLAVVGFFIPGDLGAAYEQLKDWATNLPDQIVSFIDNVAGINLASWDDFVASLNDGKGIDLPFITSFIAGAQQFFGAIDFTDPDFDPEDAAREFVRTIVQPFLNIVSRILPGLLGPLPIGLLTDEKLTLLLEGGFDDPVTIVEGSGWTHDATDGATTPLGCAVVECDGQWHIMSTEPQPVSPGWVLKAGAQVKYENVEAESESNAVRIELVPYNGDTPGVAVLLASDESPSGSHDWDELNAWGSYTVPASGVTHVSVQTVVSDEATAGRVKADNVYLQATQKIPQAFTKDLPEDLSSLFNWLGTLIDSALDALGITPVGDLLDRIFDLSDELEWIQQKARDGAQDALTALGNLSTLATDLLTNPAAVIGTIPQSLVGGLETTLDQIRDVFNGLVVTPVNSVVSAIKDWFDQWFGGGSTNAIPLSQKGAANGVAPLNSSTKLATSYLETDVANGVPKLNSAGKVPTSSLVTNTAGGVPVLDALGKVGNGQMPDLSAMYVPSSAKGAALGVAPLNSESVVPLEYLPAEVGGSGGSGDGRPWVILSLSASQSIPSANAVSKLSGWSQSGTASVTFTDGTNTEWTFNLPGLWHIEVTASFNHASTSTGLLRTQLIRGLVRHSGLELDQETDTRSPAPGLIGTRGKIVTTQMVTDVEINSLPSAGAIRLGEEDVFSVAVSQSTGSSRDVVGLVPYGIGGSHVLCMHLGAV
ncbi:putative minor tail protein [Mycobacterium phage HC]|uniref:Putative minor tail protein n=1 Tax=Mycobacterium phage HC TaxID=2077135 RepID=A0A2Z5XVM5_9CAUD|nr:minor tail protein [Mycobacterium phage HC]BBC53895.1 putative minor tail protein [Mycobacterium phage HC]